jgi:phosphate transport system permease protein
MDSNSICHAGEDVRRHKGPGPAGSGGSDMPPSESKNPQKKRLLKDFSPAPHVQWVDRISRGLICGVGILIIVTVALILVFVGKEAVPLFTAPKAEALPPREISGIPSDAKLLTWSVDEFHRYSYSLADNGHLYFISNRDGGVGYEHPIPDLQQNRPVAAWVSPTGERLFIAAADGRFKYLQVQIMLSHDDQGKAVFTPDIQESPLLSFPTEALSGPSQTAENANSLTEANAARPNQKTGSNKLPVPPIVARLACQFNPVTEMLAVSLISTDGRVFAGTFNPMPKLLEIREVELDPDGKITGMTIDSDARFLLVATDRNRLYRYDLEASYERPAETIQPSVYGSHVSSLDLLLGSYTYILGFEDGRVEAWFGVRENPDDNALQLKKIREFERMASAVRGIRPSGVDRSFWTFDHTGNLTMHFNPSARELLTFHLDSNIQYVAPNAQLNGISVLTNGRELRQWKLDVPHPDINWKVLFGKVWYEGYGEPEHIWQSSSGSDNFEAKYSLVPLTVGTLKGAFYGLSVAIPMGVLAALYTSQLMRGRIRSIVKPAIEIMAALPSVVIGFLAGLWIAPFMEKHLVAFGLFFPITIALVMLAAWIYFQIPHATRSNIPQEVELGLMFLTVVTGMLITHALAQPVETTFFNGNIQQWIYDTFGQQVEQRNSLVIGFAMGFAVIPIIFSISEDAMSNVPRHYVSGSLALGATRWQSAVRVVVPTASPGIFSAIMLGFGRAVGETMIVLMATGNTPILSFSPFNGMRTLSANIAVEIPEAPHGGSLYRVLFLGAVLLFLITFLVNTAAEIVRMRLREKYRAL